MVYYTLAVFFKWTPETVDSLPVNFLAWLLDRLRSDADKLVVLR